MGFRGPSGYTGGLTEKEIFGVVENPKNMPELEKRYKEAGFIKLKDAMDVIKRYQPEGSDPSDPTPDFANDLHATVAEKLGIEDYEKVRFYTSVGTYIDIANGVDAFMEIDKDEKTVFVTLDVTNNPQKGSHKADVVFFISPEGIDPKEDRKEYMEKIEEVAERVVASFNDNLKKINNNRHIQ